MAFATRCPKCNTVFQVTGTQLAQCAGMVRCSVCQTPFNGIEHLLGRIVPGQGQPVDRNAVAATRPAAPFDSQPIAGQQVIAEDALSTPHSISGTVTTPIAEDNIEPVGNALPVPQSPLPVPSVPAETASISISEKDIEPEDSSEPALMTDAEKSLQEAFDQQLQSFSLEIDSQKEPVIEKGQETSSAIDTEVPEKAEPVLTDGMPLTHPTVTPLLPSKKKASFFGIVLWFLIIIILLLAGSLAAIYYYGKEIVEEVPALEETVDTVCEQLSCPIEAPPATPPVTVESDLTLSYEAPVKDTVIPKAFNQKLSLANTSRQKLPWPELTLEIMDIKGNPLTVRLLKPKDYLPDTLSKTDGIEPATKHDLQLHFEFKYAPKVNSRIIITNSSTH